MKYIPVLTVILTSFVLLISIMCRTGSEETKGQDVRIDTDRKPGIIFETWDGGKITIDRNGTTFNIK